MEFAQSNVTIIGYQRGVSLDGVFPATSRKLHMVLTVHLLRVLHAPCIRPPLTRPGLVWANVLHRVLEEDYNVVLPTSPEQ